MPIISVRDHENNIWKRNAKKKQRQERTRGDRSYSKRVRAKWFCCAFILGFLQLLYKASLVFKSNLELALSIILKQRELYESKHVGVEYTCLKIRDLFVVTKTSNDHKRPQMTTFHQHTTTNYQQTNTNYRKTTTKGHSYTSNQKSDVSFLLPAPSNCKEHPVP